VAPSDNQLHYFISYAVAFLVFGLIALLDLIYANISTFKDHVDPSYLGVSYYLAVLNVPAMVVVHVLIFAYLLRRRPSRERGRLSNRSQPQQASWDSSRSQIADHSLGR
jgi:hypothetical protein